jgi:hypothetical protein
MTRTVEIAGARSPKGQNLRNCLKNGNARFAGPAKRCSARSQVPAQPGKNSRSLEPRTGRAAWKKSRISAQEPRSALEHTGATHVQTSMNAGRNRKNCLPVRCATASPGGWSGTRQARVVNRVSKAARTNCLFERVEPPVKRSLPELKASGWGEITAAKLICTVFDFERF